MRLPMLIIGLMLVIVLLSGGRAFADEPFCSVEPPATCGEVSEERAQEILAEAERKGELADTPEYETSEIEGETETGNAATPPTVAEAPANGVPVGIQRTNGPLPSKGNTAHACGKAQKRRRHSKVHQTKRSGSTRKQETCDKKAKVKYGTA